MRIPEQAAIAGRRYREKNAETVKANKARDYAKHRAKRRATADVQRFGIADRDAFTEAQGNVCAICGTDKPGGPHNRWAIDHDRWCCPDKVSCGQCIRGILCHPCNVGLGHFNEDPDRLIAAAFYVVARRDVLGEMLTYNERIG